MTTVFAASKAWNIPGLKCAQLVAGNDADLAALRGVAHVANHGLASLGMPATLAAYTAGEPWLDGVLAHLAAQRDLFGALLAEHPAPGLVDGRWRRPTSPGSTRAGPGSTTRAAPR